MQTLSRSEGVGGTIKNSAEDFIVEEITQGGIVLEAGKKYSAADLGIQDAGGDAKFTRFILQKKDWNTTQALIAIARRFGKDMRAMGFAGTKDRTAVSTQMCSIYGVAPEGLAGASVKDIRINGAWRSEDGMKLGALLGNRFTVMVRGAARPDCAGRIDEELGGIFPNYFGGQRFGFRNNNVEVGLDIIRGDFHGAVTRMLTDVTNEKNEDAIEARKRLAAEQDYKKAAEYFPQYLKYERMLIDHLARYPTDYGNAIRRMPRNLSLMYVHSVDSYIFNREVEDRVRSGMTGPESGDMACGADFYGFPDTSRPEKWEGGDSAGAGRVFALGSIVGYNGSVNDFERSALEELGITQDDFRVRKMPELNCKGALRPIFAPYKDLAVDRGAELRIRFSLPSGSYATVLMGEFIKG